jgi:hypothetical protein
MQLESVFFLPPHLLCFCLKFTFLHKRVCVGVKCLIHYSTLTVN